MRKVLLGLSFLLAFESVKAQKVLDSANPQVDQFVKYYNASKFDSAYNRLAPNFKAVITKDQVVGMLSAQLQASGQIHAKTITALNKNRLTYLLDGQQGDFYIQFNLNGGLIDQLFVSGVSQLKAQSFIPKDDMPTNNPMKTAFDKKIDSVVRAFQDHSSLNGVSIGYLQGNDAKYIYYGFANRNTKQVPLPTSVYDVASITKTFTTYVLASLIAEQKLNLNDPLNKFFPELSGPVGLITLKQLANHTSGLPNMGPVPLKPLVGRDWHEQISPSDMMQFLKSHTLEQAKINHFVYSNLGFAVLGMAMEKVTGLKYGDLLNKYVIEENKLNNTFVGVVPSSRALTLGLNVYGEDQDYVQLTGYAAAGNIKSSPQDLLSYAKMFFTDSEVTKIAKEITYSPERGNKVALGWIILPVNGNDLLFHNGSVIGYNSFLAIHPASKQALVLLANSNADMTVLGVALSEVLLAP